MTITATEARKNLFPLIDQVSTSEEPVEIRSRRGDAVLISLRRYQELEDLERKIRDLRDQPQASMMERQFVDSALEKDHEGITPIRHMGNTEPDVLIEVDDRRRVTLGKLAHHRRYLAHAEPDGTVVLAPAVVLTGDQARLLSRPDIMEVIDAFAADPEGTGVRRPRPRRKQTPAS